MLNKEYYRDLLVELAISNDGVALTDAGVPCACNDISCGGCGFYYKSTCDCCDVVRKRWANTEYAEPRIHWEDVPVDTPVYIQIADKPIMPRHFANYDAKLNLVKVFELGKTSFTIGGYDRLGYLPSDVILAREEDIKKYYRR